MTFTEQLVKKKKETREYALLALIWVGVVGLAFAAFLTFSLLATSVGLHFTSLLMLWAIVAAALVFGGVWLSKTQSVEFEYSVYEGALDVDRIVGKRARKHIVQVPARRIEALEPCTQATLSRPFDRVVMAAPSVKEASWCISYHSKKSGHTLVLLAPNERVFDALYAGLSRQLQLDCDKKRREAGL